jgi:hypothetical protein
MNRELDRKIWGRKIETRIFLPIIFLPFASDSGAPIASLGGSWILSMNFPQIQGGQQIEHSHLLASLNLREIPAVHGSNARLTGRGDHP